VPAAGADAGVRASRRAVRLASTAPGRVIAALLNLRRRRRMPPLMPPRVSSAGSSSASSCSRGSPVSRCRDFPDRLALRVGLLGDRSTLLVADHRVQRSHQDGIALQRLGQTRARLTSKPAIALVRQQRASRWRAAGCSRADCRRSRGSMTLSWKLPGLSGDGDGGVVADHLRCDHGGGFRYDGIDLAGHDAAARLQRRQRDLRQAR
jgi:hypothetical protein